MVKAITSSPLLRKFAATAVLATAVIGAKATNLNVENNNSTVYQTEVLGKEASEALRNQVKGVQLPKFEYNKKLNKLLYDVCENNKEIRYLKSDIEAVYNAFGTYGAVIELQRKLDDHYMEDVLESYKNHFNTTENDCDIANEIFAHFRGWKDLMFYDELNKSEREMYEKDKFPSAEECSAVLDKHIYNKDFFTEDDVEFYKEYVEKFISKQKETDSVQAKSDLLAYKVHLLNSLAFNNYFFEYKLPKEHLFIATLGYNFVNGKGVVKP